MGQWSHGCMTVALKCIQHKTNENLVTERFVRTLKSKIYKHMTAVSKNVYIEKLDKIVNKCTKCIMEQ